MRNGLGRKSEAPVKEGEMPKVPDPFILAPGSEFPVTVTEGNHRHEFNSPFEAAVWLLDSFATAHQVQQLRGDLGRLLLTRIPVVEHTA